MLDSVSLSTILAPAVGEVSKHIVNYLKSTPWFNLLNKDSNKKSTHLVVLVIVTVLSLGVAFLSGSLNDGMIGDALLLIVNVALGHGTAVTSHELTTP